MPTWFRSCRFAAICRRPGSTESGSGRDTYEEQTYRDSTLKVSSTFKVDRDFVGFDRASFIEFELFRE